jgi:hypothetical protein
MANMVEQQSAERRSQTYDWNNWRYRDDIRSLSTKNLRIRDYFATHAMQAIVQCSEGMIAEDIANEAYRIADEMLKKRGLLMGDRS